MNGYNMICPLYSRNNMDSLINEGYNNHYVKP